MEITPILPCAHRNNIAADSGRRMILIALIGIACGGNHYNACLPKVFCCLLQGRICPSVIGADGKIHYSDIIFRGVVHYPSKAFDSMGGTALPTAIQNFQRNDIYIWSNALPDAVGEVSIAAGDSRDMSHGRRREGVGAKEYLAFWVYLR